ncbi:viral A-type inclusion protein, putative [Trichomonas vaginalis G3]|uniref:Viral A-type inclusion protein, putative n=1 Tax=Trichomonas vaginalis (strain ATCC PRA-98 / G3) TaxID=412133 RepID=A2G5R4_TRIV3|nr:hypothetical protein TVAGG3_0760680 [Trichomonas vaginalis G3]EAX87507.1 viral A-type inclusion protein, putative [Trichomonas vaginalis G3]KAI5513165.1 hypothetical protein TVAGG3_0760680 [Trichomonas vaginalis G3]|eukprot:XP_001300437.1 viral A-type inclusion protein [Trichomonas vaginalis G3]
MSESPSKTEKGRLNRLQALRSKINGLEKRLNKGGDLDNSKEEKPKSKVVKTREIKQPAPEEPKPQPQPEKTPSIESNEVYQKMELQNRMLMEKNQELVFENADLRQKVPKKEQKLSKDSPASLQAQIEKLTVEKQTLIDEIVALKNNDKIPSLMAEIEVQNRTISKLQSKLASTENSLKEAEEKINEKNLIIGQLSPRVEETIKPVYSDDNDQDVEIDKDDDDNSNEAKEDDDSAEALKKLTEEQKKLQEKRKQQEREETEIALQQCEKLRAENLSLKRKLQDFERERTSTENIKAMLDELTSIQAVCGKLNKRVEELESENEKLSGLKQQLQDAIKAKEELAAKVTELENTPVPEIPKQIDPVPLFQQIENLTIENNDLKAKLEKADEDKEEDELLKICNNHQKELLGVKPKVDEKQQKELEESRKKIEDLQKELETKDTKISELTRKTQDLEIRVIELSDKTPANDDTVIIENDVPVEEQKDFDDDFVDIDNDASYWKNKCETLKDRVKRLEDQLQLSFNRYKDGEKFLNDEKVTEKDDNDNDDFDDKDEFGEEQDLLQSSESQVADRKFEAKTDFQRMKGEISEKREKGEKEDIMDETVKFEAARDDEEYVKEIKELKEKLAQSENTINQLREKKRELKRKLEDLKISVPDIDLINENTILARQIDEIQRQIAAAVAKK